MPTTKLTRLKKYPESLIDKKLKNLLNITKLYLAGVLNGKRGFRSYA